MDENQKDVSNTPEPPSSCDVRRVSIRRSVIVGSVVGAILGSLLIIWYIIFEDDIVGWSMIFIVLPIMIIIEPLLDYKIIFLFASLVMCSIYGAVIGFVVGIIRAFLLKVENLIWGE